MIGAIIGDIVGSQYEYDTTYDYNFEMFPEGCSYTDDSICTFAIADAILHGRDYGESLHDWCRRYPHPMGGYGTSFRDWVLDDNPRPYRSFGNGSAMRVSPVAWWFGEDKLMEEAEKTAACTHNHEEGIKGAQAVAIAIYDLRKVREAAGDRPITEADIEKGLSRAVRLYWGDRPMELDLDDYRGEFYETCQQTVPPALWIVRHSKGFEDALRQAVSLGADADTIGAIVGSMAEALWGVPDWMAEKARTYLPQEMDDLLTEFNERVAEKNM